jgi:nitroreductase
MNETLKSLFERKSIRKFTDAPVSEEDKSLILQAAIEAPTAGCQSLCTMIDVTDQTLKERLSVLCDNQPFIAKAPMAVVFLADCRRWLDSYDYAGVPCRRPSAGDLAIASSDALIAAQNSVVAAWSLGIGSCYIGDILENAEDVSDLLNLDDYVFPAAMLVYGHPGEGQLERGKPKRIGRRFLVMENRLRRLSKEEHVEMYKERGDLEGKSFEVFIKAFCERKYMSDFALEMQRSVKKYLEKFE